MLLATAVASGTVGAQSPTRDSVVVADSARARVTSLGQVTITATRTERDVFNSPSAVSVIDSATLRRSIDRLDEVTFRRAYHVVTENERTLQAMVAMRTGDVAHLGELMNASHDSLSRDFEVTNEALDTIVHLAQAHPACIGARMTGAGFGGCAVAIVDPRHATGFIDIVSKHYQIETGLKPEAYICRAAAGAHAHELARRAHLVGREHHAVRREDVVERVVGERERLGVAFAEVHLEAANRTWDTVTERGDELGIYTEARPPYGCLGLTLTR